MRSSLLLLLGVLAALACLAQGALPCKMNLVALGLDVNFATVTRASTSNIISSNIVGSAAVIGDSSYVSGRVAISALAATGYVGYTYSSAVNVVQIGWSANNNAPTTAQNIYEGTYQIQITTADLNNNWVTIAQISYDYRNDPNGAYRHVYTFDCTGDPLTINRLTQVLGIRIVATTNIAFDEVEVGIQTAPTIGAFNAFDVQDGGTFAVGVTNNALTASGSSSSLIKNGVYGDPFVPTDGFAGVTFGSSAISGPSVIAFGRDNSGFFQDAAGSYVIQVALSANPSLTNNANWVTIGRVNNFGASQLAQPALRHAFLFADASGNFFSSSIFGVRIVLPFKGQSAIDELEIYFSAGYANAIRSMSGAVASSAQFASGVPSVGASVLIPSANALPTGLLVSTPASGVTFSPNPGQVIPGNTTGTFLTTCTTVGSFQMNFGFNPAAPQTSITAFCYGSTSFATPPPTTVLRGTSFSITLQLTPPPTSPVEFVVRSSSSSVEPSTDRAYFGIGQTVSSVRFDTSADSPVGDVTIEFRSRSLRNYLPVFAVVRMIGIMTTTVASGATLPFRITSPQTLTLVPPITPQIVVDNASNLKNLASITVNTTTPFSVPAASSLTLVSGQASIGYTLFPTQLGGSFLNFTSPFHQTLTVPVTIAGSIFASLPSTIYVGRLEPFELSVEPTPSSPLLVSITASNGVAIAPNATFSSTAPTLPLSIFAGSTATLGAATVTFSAPGYVSLVVPIRITNVPACSTGFALAADDTTCAKCPTSTSGSICSGGTCSTSSIDFTLVRCQCAAFVAGRACEYTPVIRYEIASFDQSGITLFSTPSPADSVEILSFFTVPRALLPFYNDPINGGHGKIIVETPSVSGTFVSSLPWVVQSSKPLPPTSTSSIVYSIPNPLFAQGFVVDVLTSDNTAVDQFPKPIEVYYYPNLRIPGDYRTLQLYFWNGAAFVPAEGTCPTPTAGAYDVGSSGNVYYKICKPGQYVWYSKQLLVSGVETVAPVPYTRPPPSLESIHPDIGKVLAGTTGETGIQAPVPEFQPDFPEAEAAFDAEILHQALFTGSHSSASTITVTLFATILMIVIANFL